MTTPQIDRRGLFKGAGLLGGATLAGAGGMLGGTQTASTAAARCLTPFDLDFSVAYKYRPFDLIAPRFVQYDTAVTQAPMRVSGRESAAAQGTLVQTGVRPRAPYGSVLVEVSSLDATSGVVAGLVRDAGNSVLAAYDAAAQRVTLEVTVDGKTTVVAAAAQTLSAPFRFAFVVNENAVTALVDTTNTGTGWCPVVTQRNRVRALIDLRDPATLGQYSYGYGGRGNGSALLGRVQAGYFGQAGVRDPHVVQYADGSPYVKDGRLYLTLTNAGLGFFQQAHWGVWTLDLADPTRLEQVAELFFARGGVVLGDHAGQIIVDDKADRFILLMSSWGDFSGNGVHVRHVATPQNVLSGVHVLPTEQLALPTTVSSWDPALTKIGRRWHLGFVESPSQSPFQFHPALAVGTVGSDYDSGLSLAGRDLSVDQTEGTILQEIGGTWYLLASDGDVRQYKVYDLSVHLLGTLDAPYGTNIPHPMIVPVQDNGRTRFIMLTFDGTQYAERVLGYGGHGDFIVMTAPQPESIRWAPVGSAELCSTAPGGPPPRDEPEPQHPE